MGLVGIHSQDDLPPPVLNLISEPLVVVDKNGKPQPNLVEGWQVNNDATLYTFKLKDSLYWHDGTKVKASEISLSLSGTEITYPDDLTIQVKLADSYASLPARLTNPILKGNSLMGVGKYRVVKFQSSRDHPDKNFIHLQSSHQEDLPTITIHFYLDESMAKTAYDMGRVNVLVGVGADEYSNQRSTKVKRVDGPLKLVGVFYDTKDPVLSDRNFRKALNSATPKIEGEERAKTPIYPTSWVYNEGLKDNLANVDLSKDYLSKVQHEADSTINLTTTAAFKPLADLITQSWKEAGINGVVRIESGIPQNFQALLTAITVPTDPDQYILWHSTQTATNITKYASVRIDKDLEDGRRSNDQNIRKERYLDFQKVILDDVPATFLYFQKTNLIYRKNVEGDLNKILEIQFPD